MYRARLIKKLVNLKDPFKRMQHFGTTSSNIVGHSMLSSFEHNVGTCWAMLDCVGWSLICFKLFIQHRPIFFFEHAHMRTLIGTQSIRVRQSECLPTFAHNVVKKNPSRLSSLSMLLFCLSFVFVHQLYTTAVATNFRFFSTIEKPPWFCFVNK